MKIVKVAVVVLCAMWFIPGIHIRQASAIQYTLTNLGTLGGTWSEARGINDSGQVVGTSMITPLSSNDNHYQAFLWDSSRGMRALGTLGGAISSANGINNAGQVVGWAYPGGSVDQKAFTWSSSGGMRNMGDYYASAINNSGSVVGCAPGNGTVYGHPTLWPSSGGRYDLGTFGGSIGHSNGINAAGVIVGDCESARGYRPFVWNGSLIDISPSGSGGGSACAINNRNLVAGFYWPAGGGQHAFAWDGAFHDLGVMEGGDSTAYGVNDY